MVVDELADKLRVTQRELSKNGKAEYAWSEIGGEKIELLRPQTFMNDSGLSVAYAKKKHKDLKISDIYVVHDDLDIKLGDYKIQPGKAPKNHKGLESVDKALGTGEYWHVRVGVDNRDPENRVPGEAYVLQDFTNEERAKVQQVIKEVVEDLCKKLAI